MVQWLKEVSTSMLQILEVSGIDKLCPSASVLLAATGECPHDEARGAAIRHEVELTVEHAFCEEKVG